MAYAPGITYQGGDYFNRALLYGLGSLAGSVQEAAKKHEEMVGNLAQSDVIMDYAKKQGAVSPEQWTNYIGANANQKTKMAQGFATTMALNTAQQHFEAEQQTDKMKIAAQIMAARIQAGKGTPTAANVGEPVYINGVLIGTRDRFGGVNQLPAGVVYPKPANRKVGDLSVKTVKGSDPKNPIQVVTDSQGNIVPNQELQGVVRPDPFMQAFAEKMGQQPAAQENVAQTLLRFFRGEPTSPAATPAPSVAPTTVAPSVAPSPAPNNVNVTDQQRALAQQALNDPEATEEEKAQARLILGQ